jgi:hypothetical protein
LRRRAFPLDKGLRRRTFPLGKGLRRRAFPLGKGLLPFSFIPCVKLPKANSQQRYNGADYQFYHILRLLTSSFLVCPAHFPDAQSFRTGPLPPKEMYSS